MTTNDKGNKMVQVDEKVYNQLLETQARLQHQADKAKAYRKARYNRIKSILAQAKAKGITG